MDQITTAAQAILNAGEFLEFVGPGALVIIGSAAVVEAAAVGWCAGKVM